MEKRDCILEGFLIFPMNKDDINNYKGVDRTIFEPRIDDYSNATTGADLDSDILHNEL